MEKVTYNKILLTHDGSDLASAALPYARSIALVFDSEIIILQVIKSIAQILSESVPPPTFISGDDQLKIAQKILNDEKYLASNNLAKIKNKLKAEGITKIQTAVIEGIAGDEIVKAVKNYKSNLIIMATHGRSGLIRTVMGSVADHVVRHASCPVLLIHPMSKKGQK